jgi:hypothetical protein
MFRWNDKMYIVIYVIAAALPYVPILGTLHICLDAAK